MFVVLNVGGVQYKVEKGDEILVNKISGDVDQKKTIGNILLLCDEAKGVSFADANRSKGVEVQILEHLKGDKVIVFKKKRRKGYKVKNGFRQQLSRLKVLDVVTS